jgi:hypothetical protein
MSDSDYVRRSDWLLVVFGVMIFFSSRFICLDDRQCFQHYSSNYWIFFVVVANLSIC